MASGSFNIGRKLHYDMIYRRTVPLPANFFLALVTAANVPNADMETLGEMVEIAAGAGYTSGGIAIAPNEIEFPTNAVDEATDKAVLVMKDQEFTATAGVGDKIPLTGAGAAYAVLTMPGATVSTRNVLRWFDLGGPREVSAGQSIRIPAITTEGRTA